MRRSLLALAILGLLLTTLGFARPAAAQAEEPRWRPIGPWGGRTAMFADGGGERLWALTPSGHLHDSSDSGRNWAWLGPACGERGACHLVPSPHDARLWFAFSHSGEVLRSSDSRSTWQQVALASGVPVGVDSVASLAVDAVDPALVYLLGRDGKLWQSEDAGETWAFKLLLTPGSHGCGYLLAVPDARQVLLVVTDDLQICQLSTAQCAHLLAEFPAARSTVAALPGDGGVWVAVDRTIRFAPAVGAAWQDASDGLHEIAFGGDVAPVRAFAFDAGERAVFALTTAGILRRDIDSGTPWRLALAQEEARPVHGETCGWLVRDGGHLVACGQQGPAFCREDGESCQPRRNGLAGIPSRALTLNPHTGEVQSAATVAGVYARTLAGDEWARTLAYSSPFGAALAQFSPGAPHLLVASSSALQRSDDAGQTWSPLPPVFRHYEHYPPGLTAASRDGRTVLLAVPDGFWRSTDGGEHWTRQPHQFEMLAVNPRNPDEVWAGFQGRLRRSCDAGATWSELQPLGDNHVAAACPPSWCWNTVVTALAVDPFNPERVVFGTAYAGLFSYQPGDGRRSIDTGLRLITSVVFDPDRPGRIVVSGGSYWGDLRGGQVVISEDGGVSWQPLGGGQPLPDLRAMQVSFRHGRVAIATDNGVFVLEDAPRDNRPVRRSGPSRR